MLAVLIAVGMGGCIVGRLCQLSSAKHSKPNVQTQAKCVCEWIDELIAKWMDVD